MAPAGRDQRSVRSAHTELPPSQAPVSAQPIPFLNADQVVWTGSVLCKFFKAKNNHHPTVPHQSLLNTKTYLCYLRLPAFLHTELKRPERLVDNPGVADCTFPEMARVTAPGTQAPRRLCSHWERRGSPCSGVCSGQGNDADGAERVPSDNGLLL